MPTSIKDRIIYFDLLRVIALLSIITLHVSAENWVDSTIMNTYEWEIMNIYDSISRWGVPVFIMISGAFFLNRDIPVNQLYHKYIFRLVTAFVAWSFFYSFVYNILAGKGKSIADFVTLFIKGFYHLWFIYMMICLYMIVPFLRKIIIDNNLTKYFLVLSIIFAVVIPETTQVIDVFSSEYGLLANTVVNQTHMHFVLGFSLYYVAGYYLNNTALSKKTTNIIYLFGAIGFISTIVLTSLISKRLNIPTQLFYQYNSPNVFLEAVSVFVLIKNISGKIKFSDKSAKILTALSKYCFGAYLIHALVLSSLSNFAKINSNLFNPLLSIPLISLTILVISLVVSAVLNRIPVVKKYLV